MEMPLDQTPVYVDCFENGKPCVVERTLEDIGQATLAKQSAFF